MQLPAAAGAAASSATPQRNIPTKQVVCTRVHIISATYGPAEGRRLLDGKLVDHNKKETYIPYTRDVLPFLKALMSLSGDDGFEGEESAFGYHREGDDGKFHENNDPDYYPQTQGNQFRMKAKQNAFPLMDGRPMNAVFGDPCPGTTKLLRVNYLFRDYIFVNIEVDNSTENDDFGKCNAANDNADDDSGNHPRANGDEVDRNGTILRGNGRRRQQHYHCTTSRIFQSIFREHERVLLKRQDPLFPLITDSHDGHSNVEGEQQQINVEMKSTDGSLENAMKIDNTPGMIPISSSAPQSSPSSLPQVQSKLQSHPSLPASSSSSPSKKWRLAPTTSEITLPIILPFLTVRQRAKCQMVCSSWRDIVLEKGVAMVVDVNDVGLFPKDQMDFAPTVSTRLRITHSPFLASPHANNSNTSSSPTSSPIHNHPSRSLLRGLLNHSHSSLEALVLNDFLLLQPPIDLHPSLPYLRKLKRLDISRVPSITDDTLHLISTFIGERLEVLYMKGLRRVTNDGIVRLVHSCSNLRVLDVSQVHGLNDEAGIAIGRHLTKLEVFHGKDNYKLTNQSVDLITRNCRLIQATFWGCIGLTHVCFHEEQTAENDATNEAVTLESSLHSTDNLSAMPQPSSVTDLHAPTTKLILLNLWGCHNLTDASASRMTNLPHLRSLCVSECHRLTDRFVVGVTHSLPQLLHLRLRYLRRITDASLESIAHRMPSLYSLDVSFCTKLTIGGLAQLLKERCTLSELRLFSCRQLDVEGGNGGNVHGAGGGRQLVQALRSLGGRNILSFLDLRECQQHEVFERDDLFLNGMVELGFDETLHGLFVRPAHWNGEVRRQLVANLSNAGGFMV